MECRSDWYETLKRDSAMPLMRVNRRSADPGCLAPLLRIGTAVKMKRGQEPHDWTTVALLVRDVPRIALGTVS